MVTTRNIRLKEVETSLREMKNTLHFWDSLNKEIDAELAQINSKNLEDLIRSRDQLRKLTQQEIADNTDNAEKMLIPLVGTAVVGGAAALYLGWQVAGLAILLEGGTPTVGATGAAMLGVGKTTVGLLKEKIAQHWYWRWAPVPLGMGYGVARTVQTEWKMEKKREAKTTFVPETILKSVQQNQISLDTGMEWVQEYNHDGGMMEHLLPKLYNQLVTPEGALLLTHHLLESFSLSESLSMEAKAVYLDILTREFDLALNHFGEWVLTLGLTVAKEGKEEVLKSGETRVRGYLMSSDTENLITEMFKEKESLLQMMDVHQKWLVEHAHAEQTLFERREAMLHRGIPFIWGETQRKLNDYPFYLGTVKESFSGMVNDFQMKNSSLWQSFGMHAGNYMNSTGGLVGYFSSTLFLKGEWSLLIKGIPFMIAGSWIEASYKAEEAAQRRLPVQLCIPSHGTLCEKL